LSGNHEVAVVKRGQPVLEGSVDDHGGEESSVIGMQKRVVAAGMN
jgi:hypothetical protein